MADSQTHSRAREGADGSGTGPDALGDRMKSYERASRTILPPRSWTVVRLDGRAFHTWTRGLERPYSTLMLAAMAEATRALCEDMSGATLAYCQSDEISVVLTDFAREGTQAYFGGQVQKIVSVAASVLTASFARAFPDRKPAVFDARAFTLPNRDEVRNYLLWRQRDAQRNAISMLAEACFSSRQLHGVSVDGRRAKLTEVGVDLGAEDARFMDGQTCHRERRVSDVTWTDRGGVENVAENVERWAWESQPAPALDCQSDSFLDTVLPRDPNPSARGLSAGATVDVSEERRPS